MKQFILIIYCILLSPILSMGVNLADSNVQWASDDHISVHIGRKGGLEDLIKPNECLRVRTLTLSGKLADKDFFYIRNNMKAVETIDMSAITNTEIPAYAMSEHRRLTRISLPANLSVIDSYAFMGCSDMIVPEFPSSIVYIGTEAFAGCSGFAGVLRLPDNLNKTGDRAFARCNGLTGIVFNGKLEHIGSQTFFECSGITSAVLPSGLKTIGNGAFMRCSTLSAADIPESVTYIGGSLFAGCSDLRSITVRHLEPLSVFQNIFHENIGSILLKVPAGSIQKYKSSRNWRIFDNISAAE